MISEGQKVRTAHWCEAAVVAWFVVALTGCVADLTSPTEEALDDDVAVQTVALGSWSSQDIGAVGAAGGFSQSGTTYTLRGSGNDVWSTADEFRFAFQANIGDATLVARVASVSNTNSWTKAGLMMREDLSAGARNVMMIVSPTAANGYRLQSRSTPGGTSTRVLGPTGTAPVWLKLERRGSRFHGYSSPDGVNWTAVASGDGIEVPMGATYYVGLALTSHADGMVATATFDNVTFTGNPAYESYVEAESASLTAPLQTGTDAAAVEGRFIQVATQSNSTGAPPTTGRAKWPFYVGEPGRHRIWGRVIAPNVDDDSFWVRVDNAAWTNWNNIPLGSSWHWARVHNASASNAVVEYNLTRGVHTLELAYREDGTRLDRWFITSDVNASPSDVVRPSVRTITPPTGSTGVSPTAFVSADLVLPNVGGGVDTATVTPESVRLLRSRDGTQVTATRNTSGGGDVIVVQPSAPLDANTEYTLVITKDVRDVTGAAFLGATSTFTTGASEPQPGDVAFDKIALATASGRPFTSLTIGPDGKLYAGTMTGQIVRFALDAGGVTGPAEVIDSLNAANGGSERLIIGLAFDPAATATNLRLWVTHGPASFSNAPVFSGKVSRLTGASLSTVQDVVVNLPRSVRDHLTNSIAFKPGEPGVLYISQGSVSAMGAPDNAWGQRTERLLSAAILRLDTTRLPGTLPLDVRTNDADPTASQYNPYASAAALTIYASGLRNAYDLIWHSNGSLYVPTNGSAAGGATPATTSPLPSSCSRRLDVATRGAYTGPTVPAISSVSVAQNDFLYRVEPGGYYGHPNPFRCEWVLNGGNPTSAADREEVAQYPAGTQPDRNYRGVAFDFGVHYSPNGVIEWRTSERAAALQGKLLVARYSGGDDIVVLTLDPDTKNVSASESGYAGTTGLSDPLDLVENVGRGHLYVSELAAERITLLRARP